MLSLFAMREVSNLSVLVLSYNNNVYQEERLILGMSGMVLHFLTSIDYHIEKGFIKLKVFILSPWMKFVALDVGILHTLPVH